MTIARPLAALASLALCPLSLAQQPQPTQARSSDVQKVEGAIRHAGTLHLASGRWTRNGGQARMLPGVIYSNTAKPSSFYPVIGPTGAAPNGWVVDDGQVPSSRNPQPFAVGGAVDHYEVTSIRIGYCDLETTPGSAGFAMSFCDDYMPCTELRCAQAFLDFQGLPSNGCWIVDIDLTGGNEFCLDSIEGNTTPIQNTFGVSIAYTGTGTADAGPLIAGDPVWTDPGWTPSGPYTGSGTFYGSGGPCGGSTGYGNQDLVYLQAGSQASVPSACLNFGGYQAGPTCPSSTLVSFAGFYVELFGNECDLSQNVVSLPGCVGFPNAAGLTGKIEVIGSTSLGVNQCTLRAYDLPPGQWGIFASGRDPIAPNTINSGNGTLCINPGTSGGLGRFDGPGQIKNSGPNGEVTLSSALGEWNLNVIPTSTGSFSSTSGLTIYFQFWHRDPFLTGFNFTGSCSMGG